MWFISAFVIRTILQERMLPELMLTEGSTERSRSTQVMIAALNEEQAMGPALTEVPGYLQSQHLLLADGKSCGRTVEIAGNCGTDVNALVVIKMARGGD